MDRLEGPAPEVLRLNTALAAELGLDGKPLTSGPGAVMLTGRGT